MADNSNPFSSSDDPNINNNGQDDGANMASSMSTNTVFSNQNNDNLPPSFIGQNQDQSQSEAFSSSVSEQNQYNPPPPPVFTQSDTSNKNPDNIVAQLKTRRNSKGPLIGLAVLFLILVLGIGGYFISKINQGNQATNNSNTNANTPNKPQTILTYWGLWEPSRVLQDIIVEYQNQNPNIVINYVEQVKTDYRTRLQSAIEGGTGPDIFRYHNTWFPMLKSNMQPDTKKNINMADYYPIIKENAVIGGETFGVPLGFDALVLYYNTQKLQSAGISQPPTTWQALIDDAEKLTVTDPKTGIQIGGVAMGTTNNVDHWSDIIGLLLMQNGSDPAKEIPTEILDFYTQFISTRKVWDATLPSSTYAFASEKVAMIFGPSWRAHEIRSINPNIDFKTAPVPQLAGSENITWASYWIEGVSRQSKNAEEAWKFLAYLSSSENLAKLYTAQSQLSMERKFGEPYPRLSMSSTLQSDPIVGSVVIQGQSAKSWYLCSRTYDDGLNDGIIKYFEDAINAINKGATTETVMPTLTSGINQKLSLFNLAPETQN